MWYMYIKINITQIEGKIVYAVCEEMSQFYTKGVNVNIMYTNNVNKESKQNLILLADT